MARKRKNYINNKDLLKEIAKSKNSYSSYIEPEHAIYDIILPSIDRINMRTTAQAKRNKANRETKQLIEEFAEQGIKKKADEIGVNWKHIKKTEVVFRIQTFEHIPLEPGRKKNPKTVADHHTKVNFPPYQHYKFNDNDELICIGKSHWVGGLQNGHFSKEDGQITNKLANMYMMLCKRYGSRSNWRYYTYNDEMQAQGIAQLTQVCLQFDENKGDNPFAYYTAIINAAFTRILNLEKRNQTIRDDILEMNDLTPSYTRQTDNTSGAVLDNEAAFDYYNIRRKKT